MNRPLWLSIGVAIVAVVVILAVIALSGPRSGSVTFRETGLPLGRLWSVSVDNVTHTSSHDTISVQLWPTTLVYNVSLANGTDYVPYPASGRVVVTASGVTIPIVFARSKANVTFQETGLPEGLNWTVAEGSMQHASNMSTLTFPEPDGSHVLRILVGFDEQVHQTGPTWVDIDLFLPNVSLVSLAVNGSDLVSLLHFTPLLHMNYTRFPEPVWPSNYTLGAPAYEDLALTFQRYTTANISFNGFIDNGVGQGLTTYLMTPLQFVNVATSGDTSHYVLATGNVSSGSLNLTFSSGTWYFVFTGWSVDKYRVAGFAWDISFPGLVTYFS